MGIKKEYRIQGLEDGNLKNFMMKVKKDRDNQVLETEIVYRVFFFDEKPVRTLRQNRYLWGVVYHTVSQATGYEVEEIHENMKRLYAAKTLIVTHWAVVELKKSTSDFNTAEMTEYIDKVRRYWLDRDIYIALPNQLDPEDYIRMNYIKI